MVFTIIVKFTIMIKFIIGIIFAGGEGRTEKGMEVLGRQGWEWGDGKRGWKWGWKWKTALSQQPGPVEGPCPGPG